MNPISSFFANLPCRFSKENDISDITWTMCQASPVFLEQWTRFFFDIKVEDIESIEREVPDPNNCGCRVDFLITSKIEQKPYLIEVKKWDQNQHFGFYDEAYEVSPDHFGYITNYPLSMDGYVVRQWREFYNHLRRCLKAKAFPVEESILIDGYCEYLKNVCGIIMINEKIDMTKMTCLYDLTVISREIAEFSNEALEVHNWNTTHRDELRWLFLEANYKYIPGWNRQYPFIGIIFKHPEPYICAGFDCRKGWSREIVEYLRKNKSAFSAIESQYCTRPELELKGDCYFRMSEFAKTEFIDASTIEKQKQILRAFLEEVLMYPLRLKEIVEQH